MTLSLRERLTLVLVALLPLHALLLTVATKFLVGVGNAPLTIIALWKELLLLLILALCVLELVQKRSLKSLITFDALDLLILALFFLALVLGIAHGDLLSSGFFYGVRYDFSALIAFFVVRRVEWSPEFRQMILRVILALGTVLALYGILTFFLPQSFFTMLGYSDLHSLYLPDAPIAAFQQIGGALLRRIQSTMSGPNQFGLWLLIPFCILLTQEGMQRGKKVALLFLITLALILTFSRSAWIALIVVTVYWMYRELPWSEFRRKMMYLTGVGIVVLLLAVILVPQVVLRAASSRDHLERPLEAISTMVEHPFGLGLGAAGPASNRTSDACVYLEEGADTAWAADRSDLCVFVADTQVQPVDRMCHCPFLPENWYLQIGVELGVVGFILFIALTVLVLQRLSRTKRVQPEHIAFLALSIAALFLHAWEDAAISYTLWMSVGAMLSSRRYT